MKSPFTWGSLIYPRQNPICTHPVREKMDNWETVRPWFLQICFANFIWIARNTPTFQWGEWGKTMELCAPLGRKQISNHTYWVSHNAKQNNARKTNIIFVLGMLRCASCVSKSHVSTIRTLIDFGAVPNYQGCDILRNSSNDPRPALARAIPSAATRRTTLGWRWRGRSRPPRP